MKRRSVLLLFTTLLANFSSVLAAGSKATNEDWLARFPVLFIVILIVIVVDAVFIAPILRQRRGGQS
jgi:hypothetical protein